MDYKIIRTYFCTLQCCLANNLLHSSVTLLSVTVQQDRRYGFFCFRSVYKLMSEFVFLESYLLVESNLLAESNLLVESNFLVESLVLLEKNKEFYTLI